jgi:hypothetical protein
MRRASLFLTVLSLSLAFTFATASAAPVNHQLSSLLPELKFQGVTLGDALDFLRDVSGANISVNWKALEGINVTRDTQVNLHLTGVPLRKALDLLLTEAGSGDTVTYVVDDGVIEVTSRELADHMMITRVYPVEDLIMIIPDFTDAPQFSLEAAQNGGQQGSSGSGGGTQGQVSNQLFMGTGTTANAEPVKTKAERAKDLVDLITSVIFPDIWTDNGGTANIRYFNGMLVVTAPRSVQEAIGG